ncbi:MAG TPA: hypothetical protein DEO33_05015 [Rikenellaceae bacterium]|nr:hypothetical protein [Rikenellaceae bacterium]
MIIVDDVITLGTVTIRKRPEESFESYTISKKRSIGKVIPFHVTDDRIDIRLGYAIFVTGERDIRTLDIQQEFNTFDRLKHGLRLAIQPIPDNPRKFYAELRQAYPKDIFDKHETLHPTTSEIDLDQGAGLSLFGELKKAGAEVGTKQELLGDTGKRSPYLCASFSKENLWVPIIIYIATRILPIANGYTGS